MSRDRIQIEGLRLETLVGVPAEERESPQTVSVNVEIVPESDLAGLKDDIDRTIDYFEITQRLKSVAATGERKLIETLAEDLATAVLGFDRVAAVTIEVRKFILPETDYVSVTVRRP